MKTADALREWVAEYNEEALLADGFDDALLGIAERCGQPALAVYDAGRCIGILVEQGMTEEEAEEFFSFNVSGAWVGPHTPLFLWRRPEDYAA